MRIINQDVIELHGIVISTRFSFHFFVLWSMFFPPPENKTTLLSKRDNLDKQDKLDPHKFLFQRVS